MVKIELGKWDSVWIVVLISLVGFGFVYGYGGSEPAVMGHSGAEMEGVCLTDGTNCEITRDYLDSFTTYSSCAWYDGKVCPVENGTPLLLTGYSSAQVKCCGKIVATCEESGWVTYNTVCYTSNQCGFSQGVWRYSQRRTAADCEIQYRTTDGATCYINAGRCSDGYTCSMGRCEIDVGI